MTQKKALITGVTGQTFYTYLWLRENGTPYYVGKGHSRRAYVDHRRQRQYRPKSDARILVQIWADEQAAFEMEKWYIKLFGREDLGTGVLLNRTDGGEGSNTFLGKHHTEMAKEKISKALKGNKGFLGHTHTEEERKRISERNIIAGIKPSFKGHKHSSVSKEKMRTAHTKSHCKRGHEFSGVIVCNGVVQKLCRTCINARQRLRRQNEEKSTCVGRDGSGRFISMRIAS
jgi:hypothetical protein